MEAIFAVCISGLIPILLGFSYIVVSIISPYYIEKDGIERLEDGTIRRGAWRRRER